MTKPAFQRPNRLPALNALVFFEAAGRLMSFTQAAAELHVTQSAVSRQMHLLETSLEQRLFVRRHRTIELTIEGQRYHRAVSMALAHIRTATEELCATNESGPLIIAATHAVSTYWLMPRLTNLRAQFPGVDIQVMATDAELETRANRFDVAIRFGSGKWPGMQAERLDAGHVFPVCSPSYLDERGPFEPAELASESLLHLDDERWHWIDWPVWLREFDVSPPYARPALLVNSYPLLIQAAIDGHGVALGWEHLTEHLLANGSLVRASDSTLETGPAFYVVNAQGPTTHPAINEVRQWLISAFAET